VQDSLRILRSMGLKVALDDFGSGQSSLSYVHQLSLDKIKIDRGFIRNIATQENARNIVKTVIDLCRNLKFDCVVEGVETAEQAEIIDRARREDVMIYAVGMRSRGARPMQPGIGPGGLQAMLMADLPDPGLARVAEETGGGYIEIRFGQDLGAAFTEVAFTGANCVTAGSAEVAAIAVR